MPGHLRRFTEPGHVHFWTISCYRRLGFFHHDGMKRVVIDALRQRQAKFESPTAKEECVRCASAQERKTLCHRTIRGFLGEEALAHLRARTKATARRSCRRNLDDSSITRILRAHSSKAMGHPSASFKA